MVVGIMTIGISMLILFHVPKVRHDKYYVYIFHEKKKSYKQGIHAKNPYFLHWNRFDNTFRPDAQFKRQQTNFFLDIPTV